MTDAGECGVQGTRVKGSIGPSTLVAGPQGSIRGKKKKARIDPYLGNFRRIPGSPRASVSASIKWE